MRETFDRNYEAEFIREQPAFPGAVRHYHPSGAKGGHEGRLVRVKPHDRETWIGVFAFGQGGGPDQLLTCPDPDWLCVHSRDVAYLVDVQAPDRWEIANDGLPVDWIIPARAAKLLLFAGNCEIEARGAAGVAWRTDRLSIDGLRRLRVEGSRLKGEGWYPDNWEEFELDLKTGRPCRDP